MAASTVRAPFCETIMQPISIDHTHRKLLGGAGEFARVKIELAPNTRSAGNRFRNSAPQENLPAAFIPGVEAGFMRACEHGVFGSHLVTDLFATLVDGAFHDVDSSVLAFETAMFQAVKEGIHKAGPLLLEAVLKIRITAPASCLSAITDDLKKRSAREIEPLNGGVSALISFSNAKDYFATLHQLTDGTGQYGTSFDHYTPCLTPPEDPTFTPGIGQRT